MIDIYLPISIDTVTNWRNFWPSSSLTNDWSTGVPISNNSTMSLCLWLIMRLLAALIEFIPFRVICCDCPIHNGAKTFSGVAILYLTFSILAILKLQIFRFFRSNFCLMPPNSTNIFTAGQFKINSKQFHDSCTKVWTCKS